jgi:hypothetical protein
MTIPAETVCKIHSRLRVHKVGRHRHQEEVFLFFYKDHVSAFVLSQPERLMHGEITTPSTLALPNPTKQQESKRLPDY